MVTLCTSSEKHKELIQLAVHFCFPCEGRCFSIYADDIDLKVHLSIAGCCGFSSKYLSHLDKMDVRISSVSENYDSSLAIHAIQVLHKDPFVTLLGDYQWLYLRIQGTSAN
jgi:hypothetical protein